MKIEEFRLERLQSLWENEVAINLTESGVHPYTLGELLTKDELAELLEVRLGYGWTNGDPALRQAISHYYREASPENVLVTTGSAEANFLAMWTLLEPGDEVAMMLPNYMQIHGLARSFGVTVNPFHLREELDWAPDLDELRFAVTERTKMIVICNPNNPTGAVLSPRTMATIVEIAERVGAMIYADEVYKGVELDGEEGASFYDLYERAVVASGLSKALSHPGLRVGWLVGPQELIADAWHHNDYTTITTSVLSQAIARRILEPQRRQQILERNRCLLRDNLIHLQAWLDQRRGRFTLVPPRAGGMAFLRYDYPIQSTELARRLREEHSLLVLPGDVFGMDRYLRIGIGEPSERLIAALEILGRVMDGMAAAEPARR